MIQYDHPTYFKDQERAKEKLYKYFYHTSSSIVKSNREILTRGFAEAMFELENSGVFDEEKIYTRRGYDKSSFESTLFSPSRHLSFVATCNYEI